MLIRLMNSMRRKVGARFTPRCGPVSNTETRTVPPAFTCSPEAQALSKPPSLCADTVWDRKGRCPVWSYSVTEEASPLSCAGLGVRALFSRTCDLCCQGLSWKSPRVRNQTRPTRALGAEPELGLRASQWERSSPHQCCALR